MKRQKRSCLALLLAVWMLLTSFAGCGNTERAEAAKNAAEETAAAETAERAEGTAEEAETAETAEQSESAEEEMLAALAGCYAGKRIGVLTGSIYDQTMAEYLPDSETVYFNTITDMAMALDSGKIDAYITDAPLAEQLTNVYQNHSVVAELEARSYGFAFQKDNAESDALRGQFNDFLENLRTDGTLDELETLWFSTGETGKTVELDDLRDTNGTLRLAVSTDVGTPFVYVKNSRYTGFDIDLAARFCREYGYGLETVNSDFGGMLAALSTGKCDFAASSIIITEERQEAMSFSEPYYEGGVVLVAIDAEGVNEDGSVDYEALRGAKIGVVTGMICDEISVELIPECEPVLLNSNADIALALDTGKVDAYMTDEPVSRLLLTQYPDHCLFAVVREDDYGYIFPKNSEKSDALRGQMNEFLEKIRADGTMEKLDEIWFGTNETVQVVDYSGLTGENGTLSFATSSATGAPFCYMKDGEYIGYDIDIAVRFCREYGYDITIEDSDFGGVIAAVSAGKCDFGGSCITVTEERREALNFSDPNYKGGLVLVVRKEGADVTAEESADYETLSGAKIGVLTGTIFDELAAETIPDCEQVLFNSNADLALALDSGKIDAYMTDKPVACMLMNDYPDQSIFKQVKSDNYAYIFPKGTEKSELLISQMNEFLQKLREDGTMKELQALWLGADEDAMVVDYSDLTGENGTLRYASSSSLGAPFCYIKDDQYVGYDIDIAVRFCREYGYGFELVDTDRSGVLISVSSGKCDFGGGGVSVTDERRETMDFSDPNYESGIVLVAGKGITSEYEALRGKKIGVLTGTVFDEMSAETVPECETVCFNSNADVGVALDTGKVDAYMCDEPTARILMNEYPDQAIYASVQSDSYAYIFPQDSEKSDLLRSQMNEFLQKLRADGTMDALKELWLGTDEKAQVVDYSGLTGKNGVLRFAATSAIGAPFCYMKDEQYVGYDVDIAVRFCREYGYGLELVDTDFSGVIANVSSGKCDFGASGITITEEREETMDFSEANYEGGVVIVVKSDTLKTEEAAGSFLTSVKESFEKTFLRENRWQLFAGGIGVTLLITVLSTVCGTAIAFLVFLIYRKRYIAVRIVVDVLSDILQKTPVVVVLMILYYIIFSKSTLDGVWVSCIGFSLIFACAVIGLLKVAVGAVDKGQMEAALALGYTDTRAFLRMVLPQAMEHFLPGYKSEIVTLIKGTAIVGYIAVQDLTKISDIIRSRTYEAFFPLIASAVIYFILAWLLTLLVRRVQIRANPKHRSKEKILKGVQTK